jgi:glyoxylase-like metal-dependent hydrolase (beta-lactamase superfamily II)
MTCVAAACLGALAFVQAQQPAASRAGIVPPAPDFEKNGIQILPVQGKVSMLIGGGGNVAVHAGPDGVLLVDAAFAPAAAKVFDAVRTISKLPIHTIINTHLHADHTAATGALVKMRGAGPQAVRVMAQENVLSRLQEGGSGTPSAELRINAAVTLPVTITYFTPTHDFFFNDEGVVLHHVPAAHTDGDSIVYFRRSDVIVTGDVFTPDLYPVIDLQNGGSVNGVIAALNKILEITIPARYQEGGTYVIPGHGRLSDEADVVEYRDMVTIIRDRVQTMIAKKMTLQGVKAARPSRDFDTEYGATTGFWTSEMFVEAVYRSLTNAKP